MKKFPLIVLLLFPFMATFFGARLFLFFSTYPQKISTFPSWLQIFWNGFYYDLSSSCLLSFIPILLILFFKPNSSEKITGCWILYSIWVMLTTVVICDIAFFQIFKQHLSLYLFQRFQDWGYIFEIARNDYFFYFIILFLLILLSYFYWSYCIRICNYQRVNSRLIPLLICFLGIWGPFIPHHLSYLEAFVGTDSLSANLILNTPFSLWHHNSFFSLKTIKAHNQNTNSHVYSKNNNPFLRQYPPRSTPPENIILVLLESWNASLISSLSETPCNVTPNFDKIVSKSTSFSQCYSNGKMSLDAWQVLLTGIPNFETLPTLGDGLEQFHFTRLGKYADESGYYPFLFQAYPKRWDRMDVISKIMGFKEYYGAEDYPSILTYPFSLKSKYGWDHEMYQFCLSKLNHIQHPFFTFIITGATHYPYLSPGSAFEKYPPFSKHNQFMNLLYYADWSLGQFMNSAKQEPWFDKTLFIFTADHYVHHLTYRDLEKTTIPLIFYYPKYSQPLSNNTLCTQADLHATCLDFFGKGYAFGSFGHSLFQPDFPSFILKYAERVITKNKNGEIFDFSLREKHPLKMKIAESEYISIKKEASLYMENFLQSLENNQWISNSSSS